jgi:hypothetical protein
LAQGAFGVNAAIAPSTSSGATSTTTSTSTNGVKIGGTAIDTERCGAMAVARTLGGCELVFDAERSQGDAKTVRLPAFL